MVVEPRLMPVSVLLLRFPCRLTAGRRRGVVKDEDKRGVVTRGEDKPTPAVPISGGDGGVGAARRGVMPSCCGVDGTGDGENKSTPVTPMKGVFHH